MISKRQNAGFTPSEMGCKEQPCLNELNRYADSASQTGFTILEIVMALGVFILGFVAVLGLFSGGYRTQQIATSRVSVNLVAESLLATFKEPEIPGLKSTLNSLTSKTTYPIQTSADFPGFCFYYTLEPYGTAADSSDWYRLLVTVHVFEARFRPLVEADYASLSDDQKKDRDKNVVTFHTIIEKGTNG